MVTGVDIVQTQLKIADGLNIHSASIGIPKQKDIQTIGYAIQSRVTTEDPLNDFSPDTGRIMVYRTGGGFGRSEEHTSELQSRGQLVCRLLLDKNNATY